MIVYCDTSFLFSFFDEDDVNHRAARGALEKYTEDDCVVCEAHLLEMPAAARVATRREKDPVPENVALRVINRFDRALERKSLLRKKLDMDETIAMARSLGEAHGWKQKHSAFDLWHLAAAWSLSAAVFLTFDRRQAKVARLLGMKT